MVLSAPSWIQAVEPQCIHFSKLKGSGHHHCTQSLPIPGDHTSFPLG